MEDAAFWVVACVLGEGSFWINMGMDMGIEIITSGGNYGLDCGINTRYDNYQTDVED